MPRRLVLGLALSTLLAGATVPFALAQPRLVDRIVAVVDQDPILLSDVERIIALGLADPEPGEDGGELRRRVLGDLVEQRLRYHEVARFGLREVPQELVAEQVAALADRFGGRAQLGARLVAAGMTEDDLALLLSRQIEVMLYVDELLGARVFVGLEDIQSYYETVLVPELAGRGEPAPPLEDVREDIREVLRQRRLNEELVRWTEELRQRTDVVLLLSTDDRPLPPVVATEEP